MNEIIWLLLVFVVLNVLDGYTTWLGLYHLPADLRGREANPTFKSVENSFWPAMIKKGIFAVFGLWLLYRLASVESLYVVDLVFVVVVLNNAGIYLSRRISKKRLRGPVEFSILFFRRCHLPERASRLLGFYVLFSLVFVGCYFFVRTVL